MPDSRTGLQPQDIRQSILDHLYFTLGRTPGMAGRNDWYRAVSYAIRDRLMKNWIDALQRYGTGEAKMVGYLSAEFLVGPHLGNALACLGIRDEVKQAVDALGLDLRQLINQEEEPGLGNGGLGRLAACYLDSMTTLGVPAIGYGIRYEYGIFDQRIENGSQVEVSDKWLRFGNPWEIEQPELTYQVKFGGSTRSFRDDDGIYRVHWIPDFQVRGVAFDTPVPGFRNRQVNLLRLWKSEATEAFDFRLFNEGNYAGAVQQQTEAETITRILYPNDDPEQGKRLRLMQQYFFVSCSLQNVLQVQATRKLPLQALPSFAALQMNDTHPSIAVAELMRLLVDEHDMGWDEAWQVTQQTFGYTNHTLLPEALEKWPLDLFRSLLPRHLEIILEINHHFLDDVRRKFPDDEGMISRLSIVDETGNRSVRMANLAAAGSHCINGVSALHTDLLRRDLLHDFNLLSPGKIINVTNGVTPRRWLYLYNPQLSALITEAIGSRWVTHLETELQKLKPLADDVLFREKWLEIKHRNKHRLVKHIARHTGIQTNPDTLYDVQVKRIHEYKRQHLNLLHIITLYNRLRKNPALDIFPRTFIFGGKAAPGYRMAKDIIRLIHAVGGKINGDPDIAGKLQVIFFPDYNVKNSEWIYRAADLSEQISTAGKEASGTGNMKFSLNGALTIGTLDGANVEIRDAVGAENFFLFGLTAEEVRETRSSGYEPYRYYASNEELKETIDLVRHGHFSSGDHTAFREITDTLLREDPYLVLADYAAYIDCQESVSAAYRDRHAWARKSILNVAGMGYFSSDRAIREYCDYVWHLPYARE
jgi:starch phosphorylase